MHGFADIAAEALDIAHDLHAATAEHVRRAQHQREAQLLGHDARFSFIMGDGVGRLFQPQIIEQRLEALAVFGQVDGVRRGAQDRHARRFQLRRQFQRGLAAILDHHAQQLA